MRSLSRQADTASIATDIALKTVFSLVVIHAASADLTWDEAWSYLHYSLAIPNWTHFDTPANHFLNSVLVWMSTSLFGDSEFVIRLPNIFSAALYLISTMRLLRVVQLRLLTFAICVLQPYLMDYFALSRGYGIATALVQAGLVEHFYVSDNRDRTNFMLACCLLASLSISSTFIVLYSLLSSQLGHSIWHRSDIRLYVRHTILYGILGLVPVVMLLAVSRKGIAIFGSDGTLFAAIPRSLAVMFVPASYASAVAVTTLVTVVCQLLLSWRSLGHRAITLLMASVISVSVTWLSSRLLGKPLPTARLLLPFLPLWNLTFIALMEDYNLELPDCGRRRLFVITVVLFAALMGSFLRHLHFRSYTDWPEDSRLQSRVARGLMTPSCIPADVWSRYGHEYYLHKWFGQLQGPVDAPCR